MKKVITVLVALLFSAILSPVTFAGLNQFAGTWTNIDPKTRGLTRLEISLNGNKVSVHAYGSCHPRDCDWGEAMAIAYAPSVESILTETAHALTITYNRDYADQIMIIRSVEGERLQVELFTHFKDGSGRSDYTTVDNFRQRSSASASTQAYKAKVNSSFDVALGSSIAVVNGGSKL